MIHLLLIVSAIAYAWVVGLLFIFGLNFLYLTYFAQKQGATGTLAGNTVHHPLVTIQLPIYNELYVASRLVHAASRIEYPRHRFEIQVLDDSTDETGPLLQSAVRQLREQGVDIHYMHRQNRQGYKAGALAAGLAAAKGELVVVFDSDFIPPPDFLTKTLPSFADPRVAFVQTRWGHLNADYSLLTRLQSLAIDAHFMIEQTTRSARGYWFNFNGTAGVWRKDAILEAGGWKSDTLTEDLDLSYRCFLRGWKAVYLRDVQAPAELPASFSAYRRQQHRWARGSFECARKLLPQVWKSRAALPVKLEATLHLSGYGVHLLLFATSVLYLPVLILTRYEPAVVHWLGLAVLFNVTAFAPTVMFVAAQRQMGRNWLKMLPQILFMTVMGCGMMVNTLRAGLQVVLHSAAQFERTPAYNQPSPST